MKTQKHTAATMTTVENIVSLLNGTPTSTDTIVAKTGVKAERVRRLLAIAVADGRVVKGTRRHYASQAAAMAGCYGRLFGGAGAMRRDENTYRLADATDRANVARAERTADAIIAYCTRSEKAASEGDDGAALRSDLRARLDAETAARAEQGRADFELATVLVLPVSSTIDRIAALQEIQKRNSPTSSEWQLASEMLQPLFREMADASKREEKAEVVASEAGPETLELDGVEFVRAIDADGVVTLSATTVGIFATSTVVVTVPADFFGPATLSHAWQRHDDADVAGTPNVSTFADGPDAWHAAAAIMNSDRHVSREATVQAMRAEKAEKRAADLAEELLSLEAASREQARKARGGAAVASARAIGRDIFERGAELRPDTMLAYFGWVAIVDAIGLDLAIYHVEESHTQTMFGTCGSAAMRSAEDRIAELEADVAEMRVAHETTERRLAEVLEARRTLHAAVADRDARMNDLRRERDTLRHDLDVLDGRVDDDGDESDVDCDLQNEDDERSAFNDLLDQQRREF